MSENQQSPAEKDARLSRQFGWWRDGGFRWPWLARRTNGRWGLGRWTEAEVARIKAEAKRMADMFPADNSHVFPPGQGATD